jgi:hypothetical protein
MSKFAKDVAGLTIGFVLFAAVGATVLAVVAEAVFNGRGAVVAMMGALMIGCGVVVFWDRWRCKRWPQPTELLPPRVVTNQ